MRKLPIASLGLITSTTTAARITAADASFGDGTQAKADQVMVIGFQWVSGTLTIGDSTVATAAGGAGSFGVLDTTTRLLEFRSGDGTNSLPIRDFWCFGAGTFVCYYQCS